MITYTLYRFLLFAAATGLLWLAGIRNDPLLLLVLAMLLSGVASYFLLRGVRERYSAEISERIERRSAERRAAGLDDDYAEDTESGVVEEGPVDEPDDTAGPGGPDEPSSVGRVGRGQAGAGLGEAP